MAVGEIAPPDASRYESHWNAQPFRDFDAIAANRLHVEEEHAVVPALHAHDRTSPQRLVQRRMLSVNSCDDVKDPRREQRPFRSSDRERLLRQRIRFVIRGHLNGMRWTALRDSDAERESIGVEELAGAIGPIVESDDGERFRGAAERG